MAKFVEVNGKVVNVDQIAQIKEEQGGYLVFLKDGSENSVTKDRYEEIKRVLLQPESR